MFPSAPHSSPAPLTWQFDVASQYLRSSVSIYFPDSRCWDKNAAHFQQVKCLPSSPTFSSLFATYGEASTLLLCPAPINSLPSWKRFVLLSCSFPKLQTVPGLNGIESLGLKPKSPTRFCWVVQGGSHASRFHEEMDENKRARFDSFVWCAPSLASKVSRILAVFTPCVLGMLGVGAQWPAPPGERLSCCDHGIRRSSLLHPAHDGAQHIETIQRRTPTAMRHSRH